MNALFRTPRPEWEAEVAREFERALRETRELEVEKMRFSMHQLESVCDAMRELSREQAAWYLAWFKEQSASLVALLEDAALKKSPRS
jgi:hypothetical protein